MTTKNLWTEYNGKGFSAEHADYAERATADKAGNDIASTYATKTENDEKADKVASATSGNFAGLDANGNLTDSGSKASDFATATALSTHTGNSTIHVTANDKATWTGKQNTISTQDVTTTVDANTHIATGYSSDKISFNTAGRVATYVSSKVSSDLGITASAYGGKAATAGSADYATTAGSASQLESSQPTTGGDFNDFVPATDGAMKSYTFVGSYTHGPSGDALATYTGTLLAWSKPTGDYYQMFVNGDMIAVRSKTSTNWTAWATETVGVAHNVATQGVASNNIARHVWFSDSSTETKRAHSDNLKYTPSTNTLSANISGTASMATEAKVVGDTDSRTQTSVALSIEGFQHTVSNKSTIITGGQLSTDTIFAESGVNTDSVWVTTSMLAYSGDSPAEPSGNYVIVSPNKVECNGNAYFSGNLTGNASSATVVKDYGDETQTIKIGYQGSPLTSTNYLAAYAVAGGQTHIKNIATSNVMVGKAAADSEGNAIVTTYQKKIGIGIGSREYEPSAISSNSEQSIGNRGSGTSAPGIIEFDDSGDGGTSYYEVTCTVQFTAPSAGNLVVKLKAGNYYDYSMGNEIDAIIEPIFGTGLMAKTVTMRGVEIGRAKYLFIGIVNGMSTSVNFKVSAIKVKRILDYAVLGNM